MAEEHDPVDDAEHSDEEADRLAQLEADAAHIEERLHRLEQILRAAAGVLDAA